jgi:L-2,4-diaminobutyrate transaminase
VLRRHDILLIADEVVTGFGRLGSMFGSDHYGIEADIITIAKGLTSAYAPLSGSIVSDRVWKVLEQGTDAMGPIGHGWTYSAHPIGAAAGVANLKLIDTLGLVANAGDVGGYLTRAMREALGTIRTSATSGARGCSARSSSSRTAPRGAPSIPARKLVPQIAATMLSQERVIARAMPQGDILGFAPPLCLTREEADRVVEAVARSVAAVLG